jgi:hypothetical protein
MARTIIARTYLPVEIFFAAGVFYLVISFVLVQGFKLLERWLRVDACQALTCNTLRAALRPLSIAPRCLNEHDTPHQGSQLLEPLPGP